MRGRDRTILLSLAVVAVIAGFWMLVISPKRQQASDLNKDVEQLRASLQQEQDTVTAAQQARKDFPSDYHHLVVLGKAVPEGNDQASLLVQIQHLADQSGVDFRALDLADSTSSPQSPSTAPPAPPPASGSSGSSPSTGVPAASPAAPVAATEASSAGLPIGASVGPAGLPVMPYDLKFRGGFFQIADFLQSLDDLVHTRHGRVSVAGRLLTVDGFSLSGDTAKGFPTLEADLSVTTFLTPADQGITAGATPTAPAPATPAPAATPASGATPTSSTTPTPTP
jgi:hypothetical protein